MPEREHAPVPYRRCRFDGGCCRADPVAAPASAPSGTDQQKKDQQKKDQQKKDQQKKEPPPHPPLGLDIESITRLPAGRGDQQKKNKRNRTSEKGIGDLVGRRRCGSICRSARLVAPLGAHSPPDKEPDHASRKCQSESAPQCPIGGAVSMGGYCRADPIARATTTTPPPASTELLHHSPDDHFRFSEFGSRRLV